MLAFRETSCNTGDIVRDWSFELKTFVLKILVLSYIHADEVKVQFRGLGANRNLCCCVVWVPVLVKVGLMMIVLRLRFCCGNHTLGEGNHEN